MSLEQKLKFSEIAESQFVVICSLLPLEIILGRKGGNLSLEAIEKALQRSRLLLCGGFAAPWPSN